MTKEEVIEMIMNADDELLKKIEVLYQQSLSKNGLPK
jgi:hypothetical protein